MKAKIKIEDISIVPWKSDSGRGGFQDFVLALRGMDKGQSFLRKINSTDRIAISVVGTLMERRYVTRKEGDTFRIGRVL